MSVSRSVREPRFDAEVNCIGLINVLDAAVASGCKRVVFASSGGVLYGDVTEPAPETTPANPISPYGITKWVGEKYLEFYAREHGPARAGDLRSNLVAADRAAEVLAWRPTTTLEAGLAATARWFLKQAAGS